MHKPIKQQLASSGVCYICFKEYAAGTWVYVQGDCLIECIACSGKTRSAPQLQQNLFGGNDGNAETST